ncbi:hypothetical protein SAMN02745146_3024 [Hymenobacter daecheongensis DSM 21074]|uniref:DUF6671 domain-containing protein n=1 Tax=Hymenobacter daecheongensis DSM 21074 TaxID=1121955 RepID=A0A1M6IZ29_9BACT|nr:DUF6671 family protein [Hymenobacter daecheongensis]SHJ39612.1 hypothetical protein SAMN02745146_3024 [Hymenobacter daecheongensis DSM 21074]
MNLFANRKLLIATKHAKERVMAPLLEPALGVQCFTDPAFDTDAFGTFTAEVARAGDPLTTVRQKCLRALEANHCDLGVASEGSFGPHPASPFVRADEEWVLLLDRKHNLEITVREISLNTNFNGQTVASEEALWAFADAALFPSHGLILRRAADDPTGIIKGITTSEQLRRAFQKIYGESGSAYVETDMRALYNPTRMAVIEKATAALVAKAQSCCPQCAMPGFGITAARRGLACGLCGSPTRSVRSYEYACQHCGFAKEELYPHAKTKEDPMYCDFCNP